MRNLMVGIQFAAAKAAHCLLAYAANPANPAHSKVGCLERAAELEATYGPLPKVKRCPACGGSGRLTRALGCPVCDGVCFVPTRNHKRPQVRARALG